MNVYVNYTINNLQIRTKYIVQGTDGWKAILEAERKLMDKWANEKIAGHSIQPMILWGEADV